jgi:N-methylhydantoinase B
MKPGDVLVNNAGGGGGWGNPYERDVEAVLEDVRDDYVSVEAARESYRVVIDLSTMTVDAAATAELRASHASPAAT